MGIILKILFLSTWFPYPPDNGSKIRVFNLIRQLQAVHQVTFLAVTPEKVDRARQVELAKYCGRVHTTVAPIYGKTNWRAWLGLVSSLPRALYATNSASANQIVRRLAPESDLVVLSELGTLPYVFSIAKRLAILDDPEFGIIHSRINNARSLVACARHSLTWRKSCRFLQRAMRQVAACTVVSDQERNFFRQAVPSYQRVYVIPNCLDLKGYADDYGTPQPDTLIFSGALTYHANLEAVLWFLQEVWHIVLDAVPSAHLVLTGELAVDQKQELSHYPNVECRGYLRDVRPVIATSWLGLAPLRTGGGTRFKILEALALGTPVVSTTKGAEGLAVTSEQNILIADHPHQFADQVVRLLRSPSLRDALALNGKQLVGEKYDWNQAGAQFRDLIAEVTRV